MLHELKMVRIGEGTCQIFVILHLGYVL